MQNSPHGQQVDTHYLISSGQLFGSMTSIQFLFSTQELWEILRAAICTHSLVLISILYVQQKQTCYLFLYL